MSKEVAYYRAKSSFVSKTHIFNVLSMIVVILALPEFISLVPSAALPFIAALNPIINLIIRQYGTVRPVAFIAPGNSIPVAVKKLD